PAGPHQPTDALEQRRLACTIGAEESDHLALGDGKVDAEQDLDRPIRHVDARAVQERGRAHDAPAGSRAPSRIPVSSSGVSLSAVRLSATRLGTGMPRRLATRRSNRSRVSKNSWPRPPGKKYSTTRSATPSIPSRRS